MKRVAYVEPAHFVNLINWELVVQMSRYYDIDIFTDNNPAGLHPAVRASHNIYQYSELERRYQAYEQRVYHLCNVGRYIPPYELLLREGGVAVLHDLNLSGIVGAKTLLRGRRLAFLNAVRINEGLREFLRTSWNVLRYRRWPSWSEYRMLRKALQSSTGVIVHSEAARRELLAAYPHTRARVIPLAIPAPRAIEPAEAKHKLGLLDRTPIVAGYGIIHERKRIDVALKAFSSIVKDYPRAIYVLVGKESNVEVKGLVDRFHLHGHVLVTGWVDDDTFEDYLAVADVAVNLRYPVEGEASSVALRAMSHGKPVIVSDAGSLAELASDGAIKIPVGPDEVQRVRQALLELVGNANRRQALGSSARDYVLNRHNARQSAAMYHEFLEGCAYPPAVGVLG